MFLKRPGVEPAILQVAFFRAHPSRRFAGDTMPSEAEFISTGQQTQTWQGTALQTTQIDSSGQPDKSSGARQLGYR
jgi:hypothetical protein